MAQEEKIARPPLRCWVELKLFTGGVLGTMSVYSDLYLDATKMEKIIDETTKASIKSNIDRLMLEGAQSIADKNS